MIDMHIAIYNKRHKYGCYEGPDLKIYHNTEDFTQQITCNSTSIMRNRVRKIKITKHEKERR
jgi:hypothetical protein